MRVLHIGKYYHPYSGGIENFMKALMEECVLKGHSVSAVVHDHTGSDLSSKEVVEGVGIYRVKSYGSLMYAPIAPSFYKVVREAVQELNPDVIHLHMPNLSVFFLMMMNKVSQIPWIVHWHSDVEFPREQKWARMSYNLAYRHFEKAVLERAKKIIATSAPYLDSSKVLKPYMDKCCVIPLGLPHKDPVVPKGHKSQGLDTMGELRFLMLGRLSHYKGHCLMVDALAQVSDLKIHLDIVGTGECEDELKIQVHNLDLGCRIKLHGYQSNERVQQFLSSCDVLCLSSTQRSEAFGLVLLEAMRQGKPCLVSDVAGSGMSWVVRDGIDGWHFKNGDVEDLENKIRLIASDHLALAQFGENGQKRYDDTLHIGKVCKAIEKQYQLSMDEPTDTNPRKNFRSST